MSPGGCRNGVKVEKEQPMRDARSCTLGCTTLTQVWVRDWMFKFLAGSKAGIYYWRASDIDQSDIDQLLCRSQKDR